MFETLPVDEAARDVRVDGVHLDLVLPEAVSSEILQFGQQTPCSRSVFADPSEEHFLIDQVRDGYLPDGRMVAWAEVESTSSCEVIQRIARDPKLLSVFRECKGYWPTTIETNLYWLMALDPDHPANAFLPNAGGLYHYDVGRMNHLFYFFYLTDTTRDTGAHAVIKGSHKHKPLSLLFGRRYHSDERIFDQYDESRGVLIERKAGYGFVEDPKCFHKFSKCPKKHRLTLQIRYH